MRICAILAAVSLLAGCGAMPGAYAVRVPVPIACQEPEPERPGMPTDELAPGVDVDAFVKHAQAEIEIRDGYEERLRVALRACRAPVGS